MAEKGSFTFIVRPINNMDKDKRVSARINIRINIGVVSGPAERQESDHGNRMWIRKTGAIRKD